MILKKEDRMLTFHSYDHDSDNEFPIVCIFWSAMRAVLIPIIGFMLPILWLISGGMVWYV